MASNRNDQMNEKLKDRVRAMKQVRLCLNFTQNILVKTLSTLPMAACKSRVHDDGGNEYPFNEQQPMKQSTLQVAEMSIRPTSNQQPINQTIKQPMKRTL